MSDDIHNSDNHNSDNKAKTPASNQAYRVLARKYRPSSFADLIGQQPMVQTLTHAFESGRIAQAYMLTGVRGVGKTTTARILARALNYKSNKKDAPDIELAEMGEHCAEIMAGRHVDVTEMDAASHTGIDDIRDLIASTQYRPTSARYKVYIIDEVHMLSKSAFNGLLKTLEEPPGHVKFIFATTEIRKVPITVLSRCQRFDLRRIDATELVANLTKIAELEEVEAEDDALAMIARAAEGSVRDAQSLFDQAIAHSNGRVLAEDVRNMLGLADRARVIDLFEYVMKGDVAAALAEIKAQYDVGADPATILSDLADFVHYVTRVRFVPQAADDKTLSEQERLRGRDFARDLSPRVLGRAWQMLLKGIGEVQTSSRPLAAADMVLVRLTHAADLPTPDEIIRKIESGETASSASSPNPGTNPPSGNGPVAQAGERFSTSAAANGGRAMAIDQQPPHPAPTTATQADPQAIQYEQINSFDDLLAVAEKKREIGFKLALRNHIRLVSFARGRMEINLSGDPPRNLVNDISTKLQTWTGERWMVAASQEDGDATRKEQEVSIRKMLVEDAKNTPVVAAVLAAFPGSTIVDIRVREKETPLADPALDETGDLDDDGLDDYFND